MVCGALFSSFVVTAPIMGLIVKTGKIAITGGIATGKSTVARMFAELGAIILDADQVAREVVEVGTPCWKSLHHLLGPAFFEKDGQLKRRKLRDCIIDDRECRNKVNAILHPSILEKMEQEWQYHHRTHPGRPVIFDIPLLFEGKFHPHFGTIILVYVPQEIQIRRLMERDGLSRPEAEKTLTMQLPIDSKKSLSHLIIDNSYSIDHTKQQVQAVWNQLKN